MGRLNGKDKGKEKSGWKRAEKRVVFPFLVCKEKRGEQIYIGKMGESVMHLKGHKSIQAVSSMGLFFNII